MILLPFYKLGYITENLYPEVFVDFTLYSLKTFISLCLNVVLNLKWGLPFQILVLFTDYYKVFWYFLNLVLTSSIFLEIILFIY